MPSHKTTDNLGINVEQCAVYTYSKSKENCDSIDEVEASKEPQPVLVATLDPAVDKRFEFADDRELKCLVNDPVLAESTQGEELEGEWVEEEDQRREDGHKHQANQSWDGVDEMSTFKVRQASVIRIVSNTSAIVSYRLSVPENVEACSGALGVANHQESRQTIDD